jgi:AdoMet-dependent rRNA methyltransferase SPB1
VDLCAAPGGWCQVAQKYMPKPSLIIGLDLEPIKPIPGVITHVEDITSAKCKATLKSDLKTWNVDVFLHDGAPNVGTNWLQDAFTQSELTLSALKLATEFLAPGGIFITKLFRSKDYNKLIWVFNQLFGKVEATKPSASRNVSAEIFVVCQQYLAPKKIDPKILDPKYVFKELDDEQKQETDDPKKLKENQGAMMNDIFHPEKRKRHRTGYDEGNYTLHVSNSVADFIKDPNYLSILSTSSSLVFNNDELSNLILKSKITNEEIKECLQDLKVLGRKEFKNLLKWRESMRIRLGIVEESKQPESVVEVVDEKSLEELIDEEKANLALKAKQERRKKRERKAKSLVRLKLGMDTPGDIVEENGIENADVDFGEEEVETGEDSDGSSSDAVYDSDEEKARKIAKLDEQMEDMYEQYLETQADKNPMEKVKKSKAKEQFEEWYGIETEKNMPKLDDKGQNDSDSESNSSESTQDSETYQKQELSSKAKLFYENPVFENSTMDLFDKDFDEVEPEISKKKKGVAKDKDDLEENTEIEVVPIDNHSDNDSGIPN